MLLTYVSREITYDSGDEGQQKVATDTAERGGTHLEANFLWNLLNISLCGK